VNAIDVGAELVKRAGPKNNVSGVVEWGVYKINIKNIDIATTIYRSYRMIEHCSWSRLSVESCLAITPGVTF